MAAFNLPGIQIIFHSPTHIYHLASLRHQVSIHLTQHITRVSTQHQLRLPRLRLAILKHSPRNSVMELEVMEDCGPSKKGWRNQGELRHIFKIEVEKLR